jgi:hypothetical protein
VLVPIANLVLVILAPAVRIAFVLSIFIGIIGALGLVIWELRRAPIGYESEDGFRFGEQPYDVCAWINGCFWLCFTPVEDYLRAVFS